MIANQTLIFPTPAFRLSRLAVFLDGVCKRDNPSLADFKWLTGSSHALLRGLNGCVGGRNVLLDILGWGNKLQVLVVCFSNGILEGDFGLVIALANLGSHRLVIAILSGNEEEQEANKKVGRELVSVIIPRHCDRL